MPRGVRASKSTPAVAKPKRSQPATAGKPKQAEAAKTAKPKKAVAAAAPVKRGQPPGTSSVKAAISSRGVANGKQASPSTKPATPKLNVAELRARVEKLERTIETLRQKGRDVGKAARLSAVRIADLENQVEQFERRSAVPANQPNTKKVKAQIRGAPEIDHGAMPPPPAAAEKPEPS